MLLSFESSTTRHSSSRAALDSLSTLTKKAEKCINLNTSELSQPAESALWPGAEPEKHGYDTNKM